VSGRQNRKPEKIKSQGNSTKIVSGKSFFAGFGNNRQLLIPLLVLVFLVLFTFRKSFDNGFVDWDDFTYVVNNDLVRNTSATDIGDVFRTPVSSNYHPLTILTMRANNNTCKTCPEGISPAPFIRWNVILHLLNTLLVFVLVMMLAENNLTVAFIAAALFGVHPMHVESIAWISERKDVLYSFFFLAGLITYIIYRKASNNRHVWFILTFLLFILSCLSKAVAVVFPVILILINYWFSEKSTFRENARDALSFRSMMILIPFFVVSFFFGLLAYKLQDGKNFMGILTFHGNVPDVVDSAGPFTMWQKISAGSYGFIIYLVKFFFPFRLSAFYPYPGSNDMPGSIPAFFSVSPFLVILIIAVIIFSLKKTKLIVFGTGFYLITIALVLQFIPVGYAVMAERYSYLPYIGLAFIFASVIAQSIKGKKMLLAAAGCFIIIMVFLSVRRTGAWSNTEKLWSDVINKYPHVEIARRSRAKYYSRIALKSKDQLERKKYEDLALEDFGQAIASGSKNAEVYEGAGVILGSKTENEKALKYFNAAVKLDPGKGSIYYNRAFTLGNMNRDGEAITDYTTALKLSPEKANEIISNRLNLLLRSGRFREAVEDLDYLISGNPGNADLYYNRAVAKTGSGDIMGAVSDYEKVLQLNPRDQAARDQMKKLLAKVN
jgi:Flp pilus assembly protein TadD